MNFNSIPSTIKHMVKSRDHKVAAVLRDLNVVNGHIRPPNGMNGGRNKKTFKFSSPAGEWVMGQTQK